MFEDAACEREILDLHVKCPSQQCPLTGELGDIRVRRGVKNAMKGRKLSHNLLFYPWKSNFWQQNKVMTRCVYDKDHMSALRIKLIQVKAILAGMK